MILVEKTGSVSNAFKTMGNFIIGIFENIANQFVGMINAIIGVSLVFRCLNCFTLASLAAGISAAVIFGRIGHHGATQHRHDRSRRQEHGARDAGDFGRNNAQGVVRARSGRRLGHGGSLVSGA